MAKTNGAQTTLRQELTHEQRRLAKLWDAFKKQEDEYRQIERERDDLWARLQELEKATQALGDPAESLRRLNRLEKENERLRMDVAEIGDQLGENRKSFQAEQERLAKLYKVYEDTESRAVAATAELEKWHKWWARFHGDLPPKAADAGQAIVRKR